MPRLFMIVAFAVLAAGCGGSGDNKSASKQSESNSSLISDLQSARLEASTLSARKLMFTKVKGPLAKGDSAATYAAYYQGEVLRVLEDQARYGERGESESGYFLDSQGPTVVLHRLGPAGEAIRQGQGQGPASPTTRAEKWWPPRRP